MKPDDSPKNPSDMKGARSYGRQKSDKTIRSISIQKELLAFAEEEAKAKGVSFSKWMNDLLEKRLQQTEKKGRKKRGDGQG